MTSRSRTLAAALLVILVPLAAGCAGAMGGMTPSASVTTAVQGWEHWLRVDWTAQVRPTGHDIDGYVYSKHGSNIVNVQLLAQGLDANGNVVGQKIEWVQGVVPALQRAYFRIPNMPPAARYRVSVWAFDTVESVGFL
jgi:hypothetical protein